MMDVCPSQQAGCNGPHWMVIRVGEALCRYKGLAPWVGMALTVVINLIALGYWSGSIQARQDDLTRRMAVIEASDHEQSRWLERIAGIEASVNYIRDAVRDRKGQ